MTEAVPTDSGRHSAPRRASARGRRRRAAAPPALPDFAPPVGLSEGPLGAVQASDREIARQTALRARAVAEFAAARPATVDRAQGEPGAMSADRWASRPELLRSVSEWAAQELVVALSISSEAAEALLIRSLTLVHRLPGTLAALEAGALHPGHLWPMLDKVAPIEDATVRAEVEAALLRWAAGRVTTPAQLGAKARREVLRRDARAAARKLEKAIRERGVHLRPGTTDGVAAVTALLTLPEGRLLLQQLEACADALPDDPDDLRTRQQKMADCLLDLVLRPGETEGPSVQLVLTVVASIGTLAGGDEPGEIDGHVVPADMVRDLVRRFAGQPGEPSSPDDSATAPAAAPAPEAEPDAGPAAAAPATTPATAPATTPAADADAAAQDADAADGPGAATGAAPAPAAAPAADAGAATGTDAPAGTGPNGSSDPGPSPRASTGGQPDRWRDVELDDLDRWTAEMEQQVLREHFQLSAGESSRLFPPLGPAPGPAVSEDRPPGVTEPPGRTPPHDLTEPHPTDASGQPCPRDLRTLDGSDPALAEERPEDEPEWWREADRAVLAAGQALRETERAMWRARQMVRAASRADDDDERDWQEGPGGRLTDADDALAVLSSCSQDQRDWFGDLLLTTGGGGLVERPRIALTDALSGTLLALTDLPGLRRAGTCGARTCSRNPSGCTHDLSGRPGMGPPGPTDGYRPSAPLDRWVRARDRRCRQPGCRRRVPRGGELDHSTSYPSGETSAANLAGYCTGHHRGKHQAPGWRHDLAVDGTLTVTTPTGLTAVTTPPPF